MADDPSDAPAVHLDLVDAPGRGPGPERDRELLGPDERARADRMPPSVREVWIRSRALLRTTVAPYLGCAAPEVRLARDGRGRPVLPDAPAVHVSLAHTAGCCAVAVSTAGPVGVDVERVRPLSLPDGLARRLLTPGELAEWDGVEAAERTRWLLRRWTWKEALLKAEGTGLRGGLHSFDLGWTPAGPWVRSARHRSRRWWVAEVPAGPLHVAAVARDRGMRTAS
ncbi:4'-phosphopantetheinyl transferase family protein [Streptomyces pseudovenezuelae]|uniref:4'-phosphopantetheinyl transferase superfamily protein n=1 Tax=Streptomyces pseudovenezuelae TaxID=67350 RepID=A0ABZ1X1J3_9ACTN|nr:4'-phosphopantetheinyl transferase superfamily protein [Streptomyces pseudovenezuelae]